ncbi:MAG: H+transporting two-sector ATPase C subunit [Deltaproteobacteria bacterium]|nr:H+transporting two-sector ATPase C subunit [Deltaproteobacteria bacterium]
MTRNKKVNVSLWVCLIGGALFLFPGVMLAAGAEAAEAGMGKEWMGIAYISAALAVGIGCIASSFAVARIGSAGIGAMTEKEELTGRILIFLGLAEGIAIYGLIIAIMILNKL